MCDHCGRVYQTKQSDRPRFAPGVCLCGEKLMPPEEASIGADILGKHADGVMFDGRVVTKTANHADWQARPICWLCFRRYAGKHNGRIPNWANLQRRAN